MQYSKMVTEMRHMYDAVLKMCAWLYGKFVSTRNGRECDKLVPTIRTLIFIVCG